MKTSSHKIAGFGLTALFVSAIIGCASVSPNTQTNEQVSQTIAQAENLPNVRALTTQLKPKANLLASIKTDSFSMGFDNMYLEHILGLLGSTSGSNVLVDRQLNLNQQISARLINVTVDEVLQTVLSYDCLSYKVIDNNAIYIYKDPKNSQCKSTPSQDKPPQSLVNGKPLTMDFTDSQGR